MTWDPGTVNLLRGEAARLGALARVFDELDTELRLLLPEGWAGAAHEAFTDTRGRLTKQLRSAADAHHFASRALDDYAETLAELGERRRHEPLSDGLARLELQRVEAAGLAEAACREAADELAALRPVLPDHAVAAAAPVPAAGGPPLRPPPPVRGGGPAPGPEPEEPVDPRLGDVDRVAYRDNLQDLCDAVLDHLTGR
ncbi:putative T7SS-secreted protein [Amycolatopsis sp. NPDC051045]|uniref:putative T7SS-secreted protein n=1 Tax=Amycolatopsis sp. NPDC051045 TaxID=3156922 RepID=UPI003425315D